MTVADQIKILDRKTMQNEATVWFRQKSGFSALSYNNVDRYQYLTGKDLGLKPITVEQVRFEYSQLSKGFNKGLKEEDKKEGLLKTLNNFEDKNEEQLKAAKKHKRSHWFCRGNFKYGAKGLIKDTKTCWLQKNKNFRCKQYYVWF